MQSISRILWLVLALQAAWLTLIYSSVVPSSLSRDARPADLPQGIVRQTDQVAPVPHQAAPATPKLSAGRGSPTAGRSSPQKLEVMLQQSSEYKKLQRVEEIILIDLRYGPVFRALGLSTAERERLRTLLYERDHLIESVGSIREEMLRERASADDIMNPDQARKIDAIFRRENTDKIVSVIGAERYAQLQAFETFDGSKHTPLGMFETVTQVGQMLAQQSQSFTDTDFTALIESLLKPQAGKFEYSSHISFDKFRRSTRLAPGDGSQEEECYVGMGAGNIDDSGFVTSSFNISDALVADVSSKSAALADALRAISRTQRAQREIAQRWKLVTQSK